TDTSGSAVLVGLVLPNVLSLAPADCSQLLSVTPAPAASVEVFIKWRRVSGFVMASKLVVPRPTICVAHADSRCNRFFRIPKIKRGKKIKDHPYARESAAHARSFEMIVHL